MIEYYITDDGRPAFYDGVNYIIGDKPPTNDEINQRVRDIADRILIHTPGHWPAIDCVVLRDELNRWGLWL